MADPTAFGLSKMFTQLTGRAVSFSLLPKAPPPGRGKPIFGSYRLLPSEGALVVRSEAALIGSFGGALLGLPNDSVLERIQGNPLDEILSDAMHEVLNVASAAISVDYRAVFQKMVWDPFYLDEAPQAVLRAPVHSCQFAVTIEGYTGGGFAVLT